MKQSQLLAKTKKKMPQKNESAGYKFLVKGDFVDQLAAGIYNYLPLGYRVLKKVEKIIREEMNAINGQEVFLPAMQPKSIWIASKRWDNMEPPLFKFKDRHKRDFALGPTHEEVMTGIAKTRINSYRDLPLYLFQIQNKFRNEMRAFGGLLRNREFLMKDLYSFHADEKDMNNYFDKVAKAYARIFKRCGINAIASQAGGGTISDKDSRTLEFQAEHEVGEDKVLICSKCKFAINLEVSNKKPGSSCPKCKSKFKQISAIELGHIFCLGDKYSKSFGLEFTDKKGRAKPVQMGCYGIGVGRLMGAIAEIHNDQHGLIWPKQVAPFALHLIPIELDNAKVKSSAENLYQNLIKTGAEVLYDDRAEVSAGEKFAETDLIGIPIRIVVSNETLAKNSLEIKKRGQNKVQLVKTKNLPQFLK